MFARMCRAAGLPGTGGREFVFLDYAALSHRDSKMHREARRSPNLGASLSWRQKEQDVQSQPLLHREFEASLGYNEPISKEIIIQQSESLGCQRPHTLGCRSYWMRETPRALPTLPDS